MPRRSSSYVDFRAVKQSVSIVQVLDHYGLTQQFKANAKGDSLSGPCPIHKGQNPTQFRVSIEKNCWHCFSECQHGGNILDLVALLEDCSIREAALRLAEWFHLPLDQKPEKETEKESGKQEKADSGNGAAYPDGTGSNEGVQTRSRSAEPSSSSPRQEHTPAARHLPSAEAEASSHEENNNPNKPLGFQLRNLDPAHPYLTERGLSEESIATFGLGFCSKGSMSGRIVLPIHNAQGELVAYAGRFPGEPGEDTPKYRFPAGFRKSLELFNYHRAIAGETSNSSRQQQRHQPWVIVEGFFDCITLWQRGIRRVVALMGSSLSAQQEELLAGAVRPQSRIVLLLDEDPAGRSAREEIAPRLSKLCFVRTYVFPEEGMQPESLSGATLEQLLEEEHG